MTERQRAAEIDLRYVRIYDATNDLTYLRRYEGHGDSTNGPIGPVLLTAEQAKASGLPIK